MSIWRMAARLYEFAESAEREWSLLAILGSEFGRPNSDLLHDRKPTRNRQLTPPAPSLMLDAGFPANGLDLIPCLAIQFSGSLDTGGILQGTQGISGRLIKKAAGLAVE